MAQLPPSRRTSKYGFTPLSCSSTPLKKALPHNGHPQAGEGSSMRALPRFCNRLLIGEVENKPAGEMDSSSMTLQSQVADPKIAIVSKGLQNLGSSDIAHDVNPDKISQFGKNKAEQLANGTIAIEDGKVYTLSMWRAIFKTIWIDWVVTCLWQLAGREISYHR